MARLEDLDAIQDILEKAELSADGVAENIAHFMMAESEGKFIGTIGLETYNTTGLLRSAGVLPEYQGQGIGDALIAHLLEHGRTLGITEVVLLTTTAAKYFSKKGFTEVPRNSIQGEILTSSQFNGACPSTAVCMRKRL